VLSPFATGAGTARWIDPLRAALARSVRVRILTRPSDAPSGGAANDVKELVHALRDLGVTVDLRSRMHEKIAILDGHILWHGSLNILSHRDTHESMLRIESAAACSQLARFVSTPAGRSQQVLPLDALKNPECPKCGGAMVWNQGRHGIYFECEDPNCDGKLDVRRRGPGPRAGGAIGAGTDRPRRGQDGRNASDPMSRQCPQQGCGGYLVKRSGRYGPFLGCANYPKCWYTEQLH
jgi:ssDNA-binding Zn-finger/Zn-ribbon topoisomerase 1